MSSTFRAFHGIRTQIVKSRSSKVFPSHSFHLCPNRQYTPCLQHCDATFILQYMETIIEPVLRFHNSQFSHGLWQAPIYFMPLSGTLGIGMKHLARYCASVPGYEHRKGTSDEHNKVRTLYRLYQLHSVMSLSLSNNISMVRGKH